MRKLLVVSCWLVVGTAAVGQVVHNSNGEGATVSGTVAVSSLPALPAGSNTIGAVTVASTTANQGSAAANTSAWPIKITDGGSNTAGWFAGNLQVLAGGTDPQNGNSYGTLRVSGFGDGTTTSWSSALTSAELMAYNGNSSFDRLRSTSADGSAKTGVLETAHVETYTNITGATTTAVKGSSGVLHKIVVNTPAAGTITLYDIASGGCSGTPGSGAFGKITLTSSSQPETLSYDAKTSNGICVVTSATMDLTVTVE